MRHEARSQVLKICERRRQQPGLKSLRLARKPARRAPPHRRAPVSLRPHRHDALGGIPAVQPFVVGRHARGQRSTRRDSRLSAFSADNFHGRRGQRLWSRAGTTTCQAPVRSLSADAQGGGRAQHDRAEPCALSPSPSPTCRRVRRFGSTRKLNRQACAFGTQLGGERCVFRAGSGLGEERLRRRWI
jgi:hypothetical protein